MAETKTPSLADRLDYIGLFEDVRGDGISPLCKEAAQAIRQLERELAEAREALRKAKDALEAEQSGHGHYNHFDPKGTAGANCPACIQQGKASELTRVAIDAARAALSARREEE
jgi:hypothetical protein